MKKFLLFLALSTVATSVMADCRIVFRGIESHLILKSIVLDKGYQIIDEAELQSGDYIATTENLRIFWSETFFRKDSRSKILLEQVIYRYDSYENIKNSTVIKATEITAKAHGTVEEEDFQQYEFYNIGRARSEKLPKCSSLQ